ncbi:MAG: ATP-binding cassette domain-containing protein [Propionibacteriales bacterium]|nr:ATP-binding cassette domain-containing protein [Propionibacteriales bacterium]
MTLSVQDITVKYGGRLAVDHIDLEVADGEVAAIVGESGCGKTSLAHALVGLLPPNAEVSGRGVLRSDRHPALDLGALKDWRGIRGRRIGIVPQGAMSGLSPIHRVETQLREMLTLHEGSSEPTDLLERVGLSAGELPSYPYQLSGGQRQRVAIALSLAGDPDLLIADEPTTGLDAVVQGKVLKLISSLGISTLIVSHDMTGLLPYADRIAVMYAGRLAEVVPVTALHHGRHHPYTAGLLAATPSTDRSATWASIPGGAPAIGELPTGCCFAPRCPIAAEECHTEQPLLRVVGESEVACHRMDVANTATYPAVPRATSACGSPVLTMTGIRHTYRSRSRTTIALDGVDLEVGRGEIIGLVGESGSGKSTLARIALGLIRPTAGRVRLGDDEVTGARGQRLRALQRRVGFVHQDPYDSLHPGMKVWSLIAEPLVIARVPRGERAAKVRAALASAGLPDSLLDGFPGQLSGGQRQRVAIARSLVNDPELVVADEASSMLDVSTRGGIATTLRSVATERGLAVVFVTHDMGEAIQSCDRIVVLRHGKVVDAGTCSQISSSPDHEYTAQLLAASHH